MKTAPHSFAICFIVGIIIGAAVILFLYSHFVLPGKDAQISLLQQEKDSLQSALREALTNEQKQNTEAKIDTKQEIRTLLESISPQILVKIDAKEKKIGIWLGSVSEVKLSTLAERAEFKNFLTFEKGVNTWVIAGKRIDEKGLYGLIIGAKESGTLVDYHLYPKDALIK